MGMTAPHATLTPMAIYLAKPASAIKAGHTLLALGFGDDAEKVTKVDATTSPGYRYVTTAAGRYKLASTTMVLIRQPPNA